jgi:hypothetical protein
MTKEKLKQKIIKKFGTISGFARVSKLDRYELQKLFARKQIPLETAKSLSQKCDELEKVNSIANPIDPEKLKLLRAAIDDAGGRYKFCKDNPTFDMRQIYYVYEGERVRMSPLIKRLFEHFKIE